MQVNKETGGEGGIRTHGTVPRTLAFEASTFNHSVTSPQWSANLSLAKVWVTGYGLVGEWATVVRMRMAWGAVGEFCDRADIGRSMLRLYQERGCLAGEKHGPPPFAEVTQAGRRRALHRLKSVLLLATGDKEGLEQGSGIGSEDAGGYVDPMV